jgi:hypothetical protein
MPRLKNLGRTKMNSNWGQKNPNKYREKQPTRYVFLMCDSIKSGKLEEYFEWLEKRPQKKIASIFLEIIYSKSAGLPILGNEEMPRKTIEDMSFDPIQNIQARMITKVILLLLVESESKKLGIWNQIQPQWTERYIFETKTYVEIIETIAKQCENTGQKEKAAELRNSIKLIKEANKQYTIEW